MWGASVFEIPDDEVDILDKSEGYSPGRAREKNAYERRQLDVFRQESNASAITVWTYVVVNKLKSAPKPSAEYKATILAGARFTGNCQQTMLEILGPESSFASTHCNA